MQRRSFLKFLGATALLALGGNAAWASESYDFATGAPGADFGWDAATSAWEFSQLAYWSKEQIEQGDISSRGIAIDELTDFAGPPRLALHDTQVLAWQRDDCSIIAYRGTEGTKALSGISKGAFAKEVLDILTDLRFYQRALAPVHGSARVHSGFHEAVEQTWPFVAAILDTGKPAVFVGHSLGAGLATYAAYKARWEGKSVRGVWTFGSPRVGNSRFAAAYNEMLGDSTYRFSNEFDVIARLPVRGIADIPLLPDYRHVGKPIVLWSDGRVDSEWATMLTKLRIHDEAISSFFEDRSLAPHLIYEPVVYAKNAPDYVASFQPEVAPTGSLLRLILDLPNFLDLTSPSKINAFRRRWRLD